MSEVVKQLESKRKEEDRMKMIENLLSDYKDYLIKKDYQRVHHIYFSRSFEDTAR